MASGVGINHTKCESFGFLLRSWPKGRPRYSAVLVRTLNPSNDLTAIICVCGKLVGPVGERSRFPYGTVIKADFRFSLREGIFRKQLADRRDDLLVFILFPLTLVLLRLIQLVPIQVARHDNQVVRA